MWRDMKNIYHLIVTIAAHLRFGFPSRKLTVIGVTGTDGKTTTANLLYHILYTAGKKASLISTTGAIIGRENYDIGLHVTTPHSPFLLQSFIQKAVAAGSTYLVLEVTSHALHQFRVFGIPFRIGVLTNVTREHLDYHKTYENYVRVKAKLLQMAKVAVVNKDDESYIRLTHIKNLQSKIGSTHWVTYGIKNTADYMPQKFPFETKLLGEFNTYNILAAVATSKQLGIADESIKKAISTYVPPEGRQERVYDKDFKVFIDFAHTPNSFAKVLPEMRKITTGRLIHVFGAAAKRDTFKRPLMGEESGKYADIIILTAEDSRGEPIKKIMEEIARGIPKAILIQNEQKEVTLKKGQQYLFKIPDRKEAIHFAVHIAQKTDTVLLTGKGHEKSINYGHGEEPWNEKEVVGKALEKRT